MPRALMPVNCLSSPAVVAQRALQNIQMPTFTRRYPQLVDGLLGSMMEMVYVSDLLTQRFLHDA